MYHSLPFYKGIRVWPIVSLILFCILYNTYIFRELNLQNLKIQFWFSGRNMSKDTSGSQTKMGLTQQKQSRRTRQNWWSKSKQKSSW